MIFECSALSQTSVSPLPRFREYCRRGRSNVGGGEWERTLSFGHDMAVTYELIGAVATLQRLRTISRWGAAYEAPPFLEELLAVVVTGGRVGFIFLSVIATGH